MGALTVAASAGAEAACAARPSTTAPQLDLDFESGSLGPPITAHSGATLGAAYAHTGRYGCRLQPTAASQQHAYLGLDRSGFQTGHPYVTLSIFFRLATVPKASDTYANLFEIGNTSTSQAKSQFTMFFRNSRLMCDFGYAETLDIAPMPGVVHWHQLQVIVYYGKSTYIAHVRYDGGPVKTLQASGKTPQTVKALWIHFPSVAVDYTVDVDDIKMATSATPVSYLG